jgi:cytoskeletal protein RodZ
MSEVTPPEPTLPEPPRRTPWAVWGTMASAMLHVGVLVFFLWQPPPHSAEAAPPPAIDVELVPPPEAVSASEPPAEEPKEEASAATLPPAETPPVEPPPAEQAVAPAKSAARPSPPEPPSETAAAKTVSKAPATAASEPVRGSETSSAEVAPIPLSRPKVRGLTAPASVPDGAAAALTADTGEMAEGTAPPAPSAEPDVATLELGARRSAKRFYLEAMLSVPSMARARAMLETLPPEKRLAQTCNIEALAQIGNAGERFTPDVVMAEAYARSEMTGRHLTASGAIFRSGERWYGLAFDCTLSDDLTSVTAFSYRLGADVTDAVLARLSKT